MRALEAGSERPAGSDVAVFTICAANYLPQACVLADSLAAFHPGLRLTAFLLDPAPGGRLASSNVDVVAADTVIDPASWAHKRCFYELLELATSIKPECFLHLLRQHEAVFYFDPDIRLFSALPALRAWPAGQASAVLTPHLLAPLPDDGCRPDNLDILRAGEFNLGFAGFRRDPDALAFIAWWASVLEKHCLADVNIGVFTDQKWVNFATSFMPKVQVQRDPGWNAAYWNLHERVPVFHDGGWAVRTADGAHHPLRFFHFSGFGPDRDFLSKHEDRYGTRPPGDTALLLAGYRAALLAAGHGATGQGCVAPPVFDSGIAWDPVCRALYRAASKSKVRIGDPLQGEGFIDWASRRDGRDHVNRYVRTLLRLRSDLVALYDDGRDQAGLFTWMRHTGVAELGIDPALLDRLGIGVQALGVHYVGYLRAHLGVGEAARNSIAALVQSGVPVEAHDISDLTESPLGTYAESVGAVSGQSQPIAILGINADALPAVLPHLPPRIVDVYRIGCWYWETPDFPEAWCDRFDMVDEVWAATDFVAQAIRSKATVPVAVIPPMVCPPAVEADRTWLRWLVPDIAAEEFVFLFQFDVASVPFRKNPEGTVAAFTRAFASNEPVRLVIKLLNAERDPALMRRLREFAHGHRVSFVESALDNLDRFRLLASVDCFVSLHRAEGFGLSIAESMAYGVPVVTTGWSGNADFTHAGNAAIVGYDLRPTEVPHGPYPAGTIWAEPRLDDAARQMRRVFDEPAWRQAIGRAGAETVATQLSAAAVGMVMRARLQRVAASARMGRQLRAQRGAMPRPQPSQSRRMLLALARDTLRYPGYYLTRAVRLPVLLYRHGMHGVLQRAAVVSRTKESAHKDRYSFGAVVRSMWVKLGSYRHRRRATGTSSVGGGRVPPAKDSAQRDLL